MVRMVQLRQQFLAQFVTVQNCSCGMCNMHTKWMMQHVLIQARRLTETNTVPYVHITKNSDWHFAITVIKSFPNQIVLYIKIQLIKSHTNKQHFSYFAHSPCEHVQYAKIDHHITHYVQVEGSYMYTPYVLDKQYCVNNVVTSGKLKTQQLPKDASKMQIK